MSYPSARSLVMIRSLSTRAFGQPSETSPTRGGLGRVVMFIGRARPLTELSRKIEAFCSTLGRIARKHRGRSDPAELERECRNVRRLDVLGRNPVAAIG